ncbi:MAG TPA: heat-inducible transcriptional repressor HrcA [Fimbriimonadaceae bacterium]|nr:heat-inducible transcriptional repressor HrcA [Fimbriimonadaceae bacterium]
MSDLNPRQGTILRAVIVEYVRAVEPVGSELIASKYSLGVRSATIRHELAEMADRGFLAQPHTSAGRIPSDKGYRYYVDHLVVLNEPDVPIQQRVKAVADQGETLKELLRETAKTMSRATHMLSAATTVRDATVLVRNAVISAVGPERALLVLVLANGHVENRMIEVPVGATLEDIGRANEALATSVEGVPLRSVTKLKTPPPTGNASFDKLLAIATGLLRNLAKDLVRGHLITEGEEYIFAEPEFHRDSQALQDLLTSIEDEDALYGALAAPSEQPQSVIIGRENPLAPMQSLAVVRQFFYVGGQEAGTVALIGPTRMNYDAAIPFVQFTANALSETLTKLLK